MLVLTNGSESQAVLIKVFFFSIILSIFGILSFFLFYILQVK